MGVLAGPGLLADQAAGKHPLICEQLCSYPNTARIGGRSAAQSPSQSQSQSLAFA